MDHERTDPQTDRLPTTEETVHDEHPIEPAEGAREPGEDATSDPREHPQDPAEGPRD